MLSIEEDALHALAGHVRCAAGACRRWLTGEQVAFYAADGPVCVGCLRRPKSCSPNVVPLGSRVWQRESRGQRWRLAR